MSGTDAIERILNEQVDGYRALLDMLQKERLSLLDLDAAGVEETAKAKDTILLRLRLLEAERQRMLADVAEEGTTLEQLAAASGNRAFLDIRSKLISLLQSIEEMNRINKILIDKSLAYVRTNLQFHALFQTSRSTAKGALLSQEI